jgi:hypothetical protein
MTDEFHWSLRHPVVLLLLSSIFWGALLGGLAAGSNGMVGGAIAGVAITLVLMSMGEHEPELGPQQ